MASEKARAIEAARFLSTKLASVAAALESGEHPEHERSRIALITELMKADAGVTHPRDDVEDNRLRDYFLGVCYQMGVAVRHTEATAPQRRQEAEAQAGRALPDDFPWVHPHLLENMTQMAINIFALLVPEYEARVSAAEPTVRRLVRAYADNANAGALEELIAQELNWSASTNAARQRRHRAKKKGSVTG